MKRLRLPLNPKEKLILVMVTWSLLFLASTLAFAESKPKKRPTVRPTPKTFTGSIAVAPVNPTPALPLVASTSGYPDRRVINLRVHPTHLATMLLDQNTLFSVRGDLDFVLGEKVTLGPSVIFHQTSSHDDASRVRNEALLEAGVLSNIYLTGRTTEGGFILRPHVFYIEPNGERSGDAGAFAEATGRESGVRGGAEFIYQYILPNGFNFEVGGGVSYYFKPHALHYAGTNNPRSEPDSLLIPTVSIGVGWAF